MRALNTTTTGWTTVAAGIATLSLPLGLAVASAVGSFDNIVGLLGDVLGAIATVLIMPMLIAIGRIVMTKHETLSRLVLIVGGLGALVDFIQYVLFISGIITYEQGVPWNTIARGLIGIAILIYALLNRRNPELKRLYVWLSIILGLVMATSFWGLIFQDEINAIMQGNLTEANPILLATIFISAPIFLLGWPIWLIWTGRLFLKGKLAVPELNEPASRTV